MRTWSTGALDRGTSDRGTPDGALTVGSLQKPFVAKAWATSHPDQGAPRFTCAAGGGCWFPSGHGDLGLSRALAVSCNAYFRRLAQETPLRALNETFAREGFLGAVRDADAAVGIPGDPPMVIRPSRLLEAYARMVREPWTEGEAIRTQVLAGLRAAPRSGTAALLGLGGCWAKTGTVPAPEPGRTRGLVLVLEDAGRGTLAELDPGTGREAAAALGRRLRQGLSNPDPGQAQTVLVQLFDLLPARTWTARNLETGAIPARGGFLGPGATRILSGGDWVGPGLLELGVPGASADTSTGTSTSIIRRMRGRVAVHQDREGRPRLTACLDVREYIGGVINAELPTGGRDQRIALGAAALRFLAAGPRHAGFDVCDSTHCAWFAGRGPRMRWDTPGRATPAGQDFAPPPGEAEWRAMQVLAATPGPDQWSSECGGAPLSPHALWGGGDRRVLPCPRHGGQRHPSWQREWTARDLERAFGGPVLDLALEHPDGVWTLAVHTSKGLREYRFDEAHRALARILGWDALPSPADSINPCPGGYRAAGVGKGHRVGLCLGE